MEDIIFEHKQLDNGFLVDIKIINVKKDQYYPEGIKYSLVVIDRRTGKRLLGFDNCEKKGYHIHRLKRELKYNFTDEWKLIEDFYKEYEKLKRRLLR
ncbi:MAG: toxin-antitoxin system TumE family protein [Paludibacter sp.]